jgi:hypothetical protein
MLCIRYYMSYLCLMYCVMIIAKRFARRVFNSNSLTLDDAGSNPDVNTKITFSSVEFTLLTTIGQLLYVRITMWSAITLQCVCSVHLFLYVSTFTLASPGTVVPRSTWGNQAGRPDATGPGWSAHDQADA